MHIWAYSYELFLAHGTSGTSWNMAFECGSWTRCCLWLLIFIVSRLITTKHCLPCTTSTPTHLCGSWCWCPWCKQVVALDFAKSRKQVMFWKKLRKLQQLRPATPKWSTKWNLKEVLTLYLLTTCTEEPRCASSKAWHQDKTPEALFHRSRLTTQPTQPTQATQPFNSESWKRTLSASDLDVMVASNSSV